LFLAQKILEKNQDELPILQSVKVPKSWYITTILSEISFITTSLKN
jgi:hypothetical protein